jgi:S-adenosylmethionine hydrolase
VNQKQTPRKRRRAIITLTSDFGLDDPYVGAVRGVIAGIDPDALVIDVTHAVPPQAIAAGAFALYQAYRAFPPATVHWAVVDPGVGTARRAILVQTGHGWFVGPDNGIFSYVLEREQVLGCWILDRPAYWRHPVSATFHGRDIFAPVAAHLARLQDATRFGTVTDVPPMRLPPLAAQRRQDDKITGHVLWVDHFGNLITNLPEHLLASEDRGIVQVGQEVVPFVRTYQEAPDVSLVALVGSSGFIELAVPNGSAARRLELGVGAPVLLPRS